MDMRRGPLVEVDYHGYKVSASRGDGLSWIRSVPVHVW